MRRLPSILISVALLLLGGFIYYLSTYVSGTEVEVRSWRLRSFSFRRDPFTNFQFTGVTHEASQPSSLWTTQTNFSSIDPSIQVRLSSKLPASRWDLVQYDQSFVTGDAKVLINLLSMRDASYDLVWAKWTKDNPQKAAVLWPAAQLLVYWNAYANLPSLFEIALLDVNQSEFKEEVDLFMLQTVTPMVERLSHEGDTDSAKSLAESSIRYGTNDILQAAAPDAVYDPSLEEPSPDEPNANAQEPSDPSDSESAIQAEIDSFDQ